MGLDDVVGKRTLKEMLDEPDKVLDVGVADSSNERVLEKVVEKEYEPKSIDVLKETGKDIAYKFFGISKNVIKAGAYFTGGISAAFFMPFFIPYSNKVIDCFKNDLNNISSFSVGVGFGGIGAFFVYPSLIAYGLAYSENVPNEAYIIFPGVLAATNIFSYAYKRFQVNKIKLSNKKKSLEGVVKDE